MCGRPVENPHKEISPQRKHGELGEGRYRTGGLGRNGLSGARGGTGRAGTGSRTPLVLGRQRGHWRFFPDSGRQPRSVFHEAPTENILPPTHTLHRCNEVVVNSLFQDNGISTALHQQACHAGMRITAQHHAPYRWIDSPEDRQLFLNRWPGKGRFEHDHIPLMGLQERRHLVGISGLCNGSGLPFFKEYLPEAGTNMRVRVPDHRCQLPKQGATTYSPVRLPREGESATSFLRARTILWLLPA